MAKINIKHGRLVLIFAIVIFLIALVSYISTTCRTIAPYRDSGELICAADTLSIAHSPGYPTYMITGKVFTTFGEIFNLSPAYSMNLHAALCGSLAVLFMYLIICSLSNNILSAFIGGLLFCYSYMHWYLSSLAEMYSMNIMFVLFLLLLIQYRKYLLFFFCCALMLGNHLSSLFACLPMIIYIYLKKNDVKLFWGFMLSFLIGISVYLYLPIRALNEPFINWGDPSSFFAFINVVSRASYGHTLDLVSREVSLSQVILPHFVIFLKALIQDLSLAGVLLSAFGLIHVFFFSKLKKGFYQMLLAVFIMTGPLFLYIAKMPVNPHALAIVEVAYIIPSAVLVIFAGYSITLIFNQIRNKFRYVLVLSLTLIPVKNSLIGYSKVNMKNNFIASDYAENMLGSVSENAIIIMRRDHPLFSVWYKRYMENYRTDIIVLSKGLLSAKWYRKKMALDHPEIAWKQDYSNDENYIKWICSYAEKYPVYMTSFALSELSSDFYDNFRIAPFGLLLAIKPVQKAYDPMETDQILRNYKYNSFPSAELYYDYFSKDILSLYAQAYDSLGLEMFKQNSLDHALNLYLKAIEFNKDYYRVYLNIAYLYYNNKKYKEAVSYYIQAIEKLDIMIATHTRKSFFYPELSDAYNNLGAVYEKQFRLNKQIQYFESAKESYEKSVNIRPDFSKGYYNLGVLYWVRADWKNVVVNLKKAHSLDMKNREIKKYLDIAEINLRQK